jgi:hypothetical protein
MLLILKAHESVQKAARLLICIIMHGPLRRVHIQQCTHSVYTFSVHIQCTHAVYTFSVHMQCTHSVYIFSVHIQQCTHSVCTFSVHIQCTHSVYTFSVHIQQCTHSVYTFSVHIQQTLTLASRTRCGAVPAAGVRDGREPVPRCAAGGVGGGTQRAESRPSSNDQQIRL